MKKLISTLILSGLLFIGFGQKAFKPIHFSSYMETKSSLDGDIKGPEQHIAGTIIINNKKSLITIAGEGQSVSTFKIIKAGKEENSEYGKKLTISCKDAAGNPCTFIINRIISSSYSYMKIYLSSGQKYLTYSCDYLKKLN